MFFMSIVLSPLVEINVDFIRKIQKDPPLAEFLFLAKFRKTPLFLNLP